MKPILIILTKYRAIRFAFVAAFLATGIQLASAFALLGPFAPWMANVPGYHTGSAANAIGGPMNIGEGYRWNVPVITYCFDNSFYSYFGTNGVAAVEAAIQILNNLPPASSNAVASYGQNTTRVNAAAAGMNLEDLESAALALLVEQMGLSLPSDYVFCLSNPFVIQNGFYGLNIRNFDPITLTPTTFVNGQSYTYYGSNTGTPLTIPTNYVSSGGFVIIGIDPTKSAYRAIADYMLTDPSGLTGRYYTGLTRDDVGGLNYLVSTNNIAMESLIAGVRGSGTNASNFVNRALRPGVDKITFQELSFDTNAGSFTPVTNVYTDTYISNNVVQHQTLERVILKPDILFTATNVGLNTFSRSGTTNWVNNGAPLHDGPGVIQPPVVINLNPLGQTLQNGNSDYSGNPLQTALPAWGSYNGATNAPIAHPVFSYPQFSTMLNFYLYSPHGLLVQSNSWKLQGQTNALFLLQTATNITDWLTIATVTNSGTNFTYLDYVWTNTPQRFFRTVLP